MDAAEHEERPKRWPDDLLRESATLLGRIERGEARTARMIRRTQECLHESAILLRLAPKARDRGRPDGATP